MSVAEPVRIGVVGADVPRQIVLAAGATPVRLFGAWEGDTSAHARELLGAVDAVAVRLLDDLLAGRCDDLSALVVCNDSAAHLRLFYVLRVLASRGDVPFGVHLLDAPRAGGAPRRRFVSWQYARLAGFVSERTGRTVDADALGRAAAREARLVREIDRMRTRRMDGTCSGAAALDAYRAALTLPPEQAADVVAGAVEPASGAVPVVVTGSTHPASSVYTAIEREGLRIVGEDHDAGDAAWIGAGVEAATPQRAFDALAEAHVARPPAAARSTSAERAEALRELVSAAGARAVLAVARDLDDAPAWDLSAQRAVLEPLGVQVEAALRIGADEAVSAVAEPARRIAENQGERA